MFDFFTQLDYFPILPWWIEPIAFVSAVYAIYKLRLIYFVGKLLMPKEISQRWGTLATKTDIGSAKLSEKFVEQLVEPFSDSLVERVLAELPEAMELRAQETIANLTAQVSALRKQVRGDDCWILVGVHVRGFKMSEDDKEEYFALVEYNNQTGVLRAHQNSKKRLLVPTSKMSDSYSPFYGYSKVGNWLGAPWYGKVNGDPRSIVMLWEVYTLLD